MGLFFFAWQSQLKRCLPLKTCFVFLLCTFPSLILHVTLKLEACERTRRPPQVHLAVSCITRWFSVYSAWVLMELTKFASVSLDAALKCFPVIVPLSVRKTAFILLNRAARGPLAHIVCVAWCCLTDQDEFMVENEVDVLSPFYFVYLFSLSSKVS